MPVSRYNKAPVITLGTKYGTSTAVSLVRAAVASGQIPTKEIVVRGAERLDTIAGELYGDSRYWWVLAATSNIGWGLQIPPGTVLNVASLQDVLEIVG